MKIDTVNFKYFFRFFFCLTLMPLKIQIRLSVFMQNIACALKKKTKEIKNICAEFKKTIKQTKLNWIPIQIIQHVAMRILHGCVMMKKMQHQMHTNQMCQQQQQPKQRRRMELVQMLM